MTGTDLATRLRGLLGAPAESAGFELVAVEVAGTGRAPLVRVYLDRDDGIDIDAIAAANAWVKPLLDAVPELGERYTLELSSPGIDRPLTTLRDFQRFAGSAAKVSTRAPIEGRKHFTGTLGGVQGDDVLIEDGDTTYRIPLEAVTKARLKGEIDLT